MRNFLFSEPAVSALTLRKRSHSNHEVIFEPRQDTDESRVRCASTSIHDRVRRSPQSPTPATTPPTIVAWPPSDAQASGVATLLARSTLQLSLPIIPPPALVPLLVEHPPTGDEHYGPPFRAVINSSYLNAGSSGNNSAKSAPSSPNGDWTSVASGSVGVPSSPGASTPTPPRSPSNSASKHDKSDRHNLKQLNVGSAPAMTQAPTPLKGAETPVVVGAPGAVPLTPTPDEPGSSKSRQKKFHRHFKKVAQDERVLNYYSCALVADILLQGQLYITKNHFAFYSNVFGYVTKLLIPTESVLKISKEKTARIIPNAVGVSTREGKHVFGSLLSRDSTYRLMTAVWKDATGPEPLTALPVTADLADDVDTARILNLQEGYESSLSGSERSIILTPSPASQLRAGPGLVSTKKEVPVSGASAKMDPILPSSDKKSSLTQPNTLLLVSTALLIFLFLSAAFLLYRISIIQTQFADNPLLSGSDQVYQEILKWQAQLHSRSANEVQEFLNSNLDQLAKVRKSLEALSQLLLRNDEYAQRRMRDRTQSYDTSSSSYAVHSGNS